MVKLFLAIHMNIPDMNYEIMFLYPKAKAKYITLKGVI